MLQVQKLHVARGQCGTVVAVAVAVVLLQLVQRRRETKAAAAAVQSPRSTSTSRCCSGCRADASKGCRCCFADGDVDVAVVLLL
jgi:hypothetical protein